VGLDRCGGDNLSVTLAPDRDDYDSPAGTRGGYVRIDLHCPGDHHSSLIIGNHKGAEILTMVARDHCEVCDEMWRQYEAQRPAQPPTDSFLNGGEPTDPFGGPTT
jgi:hypothetical protein